MKFFTAYDLNIVEFGVDDLALKNVFYLVPMALTTGMSRFKKLCGSHYDLLHLLLIQDTNLLVSSMNNIFQ